MDIDISVCSLKRLLCNWCVKIIFHWYHLLKIFYDNTHDIFSYEEHLLWTCDNVPFEF